MKKVIAKIALAAALVTGAAMITAAPASAQSFGFSLGGPGYSFSYGYPGYYGYPAYGYYGGYYGRPYYYSGPRYRYYSRPHYSGRYYGRAYRGYRHHR
jgi:hypothetical protein